MRASSSHSNKSLDVDHPHPPSYREAKSDHSPTEKSHFTPPNPRTPNSGISDSAMKKLGGHTPPSSSRSRNTPVLAQSQKSRFEVIPNNASGYSTSGTSPRGLSTTPARDGIYTSTSSSGTPSAMSYGNTPVVSVELSLNRSVNSRSRTSSGSKQSPRR